MILNYEYSVVGSSHVNKGIVNQDSKKIENCENGWVIAAIADGVGSCIYSNVASSIAVDVSVSVCLEEIKTAVENATYCKLLKRHLLRLNVI